MRNRLPIGRNFFGDDEFMSDFFNDLPALGASTKQFKVDIKENDKEYMIDADLPGVNKDDIVVEYKDKYLTISAEKEQSTEEKGENFIRRERSFGSIKRSFYVDDIDESQAIVEYKDGVLKIVLPKLVEPKSGGTKFEIK
ncbi:Hsp20/alpha crystallin family protein [Youngiibacter multivorans]|uniref:HSP20 family protein n=1 Tax=Youngiibacter multivorans TaxID=937251 RepID=A0ABS4G8P0_9CLOT|nr:Hsp20/alpha crystallin family protein [Youngiibacter multivorans]MBP1920902.1 HSP20 family protein [Youngiibacter multivorans]